MYNIDMYDYNPKPFSYSRRYCIHPLAEEDRGIEKFLGYDSHNHNYQSRLNPKVFREIVGMDYESIVAQQEKDIAAKKAEANAEQKKQCDGNQPVTTAKAPHKVKFHPDNEVQVIGDNESSPNDDYHHQHKPMTEQQMALKKEEEKCPQYDNGEHLPDIGANTGTTTGMSGTNQLKDPMRQTARHYHRKYNFKDIYGYEKPIKCNTNLGRTLTQMNHLKRNKLSNNEFQSSHSKDFYAKKRYDGFTSYCVPRTDEINPTTARKGTPFDIYSRSIAKVMASSTMSDPNRNCQTEYESLQLENEKMKEIIQEHTNTNWMHSKNLPSVGTILDKNKKTIRNTSIGNSKIMGEKYNPFNNYFGSKNRTGRNFTGALFQH